MDLIMKHEARDARAAVLRELRREVVTLKGAVYAPASDYVPEAVSRRAAADGQVEAFVAVIHLIDRKLHGGGDKKHTRRQ